MSGQNQTANITQNKMDYNDNLFSDEPVPDHDPGLFSDEPAPNTPQRSGFDTMKERAMNVAPLPAQLGMKAMELAQSGANTLGEKTAESLASGVSLKNHPFLPAPFNVFPESTPGKGMKAPPEVAAGIGTAIQMAPDIISSVAPMMGGETAAKVGQEAVEAAPNFLQKIGAQSLNKSAGIQPRTLMKMAGSQNPAEVGTELGQALYKEGATGFSPGATFDKASAVKQQFGKAVGDALGQIKESGMEVETAANKALKPILDKWAELGDATLSQNRVMAKPYAEIFSKLEKAANAKGGSLGIDDVQNEMEEVGKLFNKISKTSDKYPALAELYGTLADVRDGIVQDIAERAGNPALKSQLLEANKGFSRYSRIMPDIAKAAAKEGAGGDSFSFMHPIKSTMDAMRPALSKSALFLGDLLSHNPASLGKYAPVLMNEATKGPENLQSFHHSLLDHDPAYYELFQKAANQ